MHRSTTRTGTSPAPGVRGGAAPQQAGRRPAGWLLAVAAACALGWATRPAEASFLYATASGEMVGGQPVSAQALFTITAGHINIQLTNLLANPTSDIQTLNGVQFVLSTGQTIGTNLTSSAQHRQIDSNDPFPTGWHDVGVSSTTWNLNNNVASGIELTSIGNTGGAPTLIGGPRASDNAYAAANGSIAGSTSHNPFLAGTATFDLDIVGLPADATILSMRFEFGTTANNNAPGELVPEPSSLALVGLGLGAVGLIGLRRRRPTAA